MRKATIMNPSDDEKVALSEFSINVHHKSGRVINLTCNNYTYDDVFEYIKEQYEFDLDYIEEITIKVKK
ncbi:hypothetical protein [Priestia sp. YIM B13489]|uniref:hypothetical protein n=1 Tax=Priestia TaxID=2800373 RepID=UPI00366DA484